MKWIIFEIATGYIKSVHDTEPSVQAGEATAQTSHIFYEIQPIILWKWDGDSVLECTEEEIEERTHYGGEKKPLIFELVNEHLQSKYFHDVNYNTELSTGNRLHKVHEYTNDGFILRTKAYDGYVDEQDKGVLILVVEESYQTNPDQAEVHPTARETISRNKIRKWANDEGDESKFHSDYKTTSKLYDTRKKKSDEGFRRRANVIDMLSENVGLAGVLSGTFIDGEDAFNKLTTLLATHSTAFSIYKQTGRGDIFTTILEDTSNTWLSATVLDTPYTQGMCPWMIGMTFRDYIIDKLKGLIK